MKKLGLFLIMFISAFAFTNVEAATSYTVKTLTNTSASSSKTYTSYSSALSDMKSRSASSTSVPTLYKNDTIVNSTYAIFRFKPGSVYYLYPSASSTTSYTYIHGSYGTDAAFLDYDATSGRVKIKISGYTGWTPLSKGVIAPISTSNIYIKADVKVRSSYSTSSTSLGVAAKGSAYIYTATKSSGGYTWYKINYGSKTGWIAYSSSWEQPIASMGKTYYQFSDTNNFYHTFMYHNGSNYSTTSTNLAKAPSGLAKNTKYYSYDGNYFYTSQDKMLKDYKNNTYTNAVNKTKPNYSYYQYLTAHSSTAYSASDFDTIIKNYEKSSGKQSVLDGQGKYFIESQTTYGINALLTFGTAVNESAYGTSSIAKSKYNVFGYGATDSNPNNAVKYSSVRASILAYAKASDTNYSLPSGTYYHGGHYGNKAAGKNVKYASDPYWGEKAASNAYSLDKKFGSKDYNANTLALSNYGVTGIKAYNSSGSAVYTIVNKNEKVGIYNVSVNIVDTATINGTKYYKIYSDASSGYVYVLQSKFYKNNNQPTITASNRTIYVGEKFDYKSGVSAKDTEDGNITSKIKYSGTVDTSKKGTYTVTYSVKDSNNFSATKKVTINVPGPKEPTINASDSTVTLNTSFNALSNVTASDVVDGNITKKIKVKSSNVNVKATGKYQVTYTVTNSKSLTTEKTVNVNVIPDQEPVITLATPSVYLYSTYNAKTGLSIKDREDGNITSKVNISTNVNTSKPGTYKTTYTVTDSKGHKVTKAVTIKIDKLPKTTLKLYNTNYNQIKITYSKITGAYKYQIFRSTSKNGTYTKINSIKDLYYYDSNLKYSQTYYYKVRTYKTINGKTYYSDYSNVYSKSARPPKPTIKVTKFLSNAIKVNYSKENNVTGYRIYRSSSSNETFSCIKETKGLYFINLNLNKATYYYKVRTFKKVGNKKYYSEYSTLKYYKL